MIIKNIKGEYHYHDKGTSKELPTRDFCKPLKDEGGIKSIRVMSIEEATRLGILNEPVVDEDFNDEEFGVKSISMVDDPLPGFEFVAYDHAVNFIIPKP